jgi:uncharacterized membrane protein
MWGPGRNVTPQFVAPLALKFRDGVLVAASWGWSHFVVRPIKGAVIGSGLLLGYEGQARVPSTVGVDPLRYDQQQIASPLD